MQAQTIRCKFCRGSGYQSNCLRGCRAKLSECEAQHHEIATHACEGTAKSPGCRMTGVTFLGTEGFHKDDPMHARNAPLRVSILSALAHKESARSGVTHAQAEWAIATLLLGDAA